MNAKSFGLWCLLAWLWGSSFLAIGIGVETLDPFSLVAGRMVIGAVLLGCILFVKGGNLRLGVRGWMIAIILGASGNVVPFLLISFAEQTVDSGVAALIMGVAPVVTLTIAPLIHVEETLGSTKIIGAAIGFAGIIILVGPETINGLGGTLIPQIALVCAALCYSFTALFSRRFSHSDPIQMATASVLVGAISISIIAGLRVVETGLVAPSFRSSLATVYLGIGPTAMAALIYFWLIPRIGAGRLQQVNYVVPVMGTILGIMFLGEQPSWNALVAIPMITVAVCIVSWSGGKLRKS